MEKRNTSKHKKQIEAGILWSIFVTFLKIGVCTFGGGYAMIPLIEREIVEKKGWLKSEEILEVIAIAESTPGPIAVNSATFVGYRICGSIGGFMATFGVVLPSFCIISILSLIMNQVEHLKPVAYAFWGIRAGVLALIGKAFFYMYRQCEKGLLNYCLMFFAFLAVAILHINAIITIIICGCIGLLSTLLVKKKGVQK